VYVNYGRVEDFQFLERNMSINVTGKIVLARYGKIFRGNKVNKILNKFDLLGESRLFDEETFKRKLYC
jgi:hypothetical protein